MFGELKVDGEFFAQRVFFARPSMYLSQAELEQQGATKSCASCKIRKKPPGPEEEMEQMQQMRAQQKLLRQRAASREPSHFVPDCEWHAHLEDDKRWYRAHKALRIRCRYLIHE